MVWFVCILSNICLIYRCTFHFWQSQKIDKTAQSELSEINALLMVDKWIGVSLHNHPTPHTHCFCLFVFFPNRSTAKEKKIQISPLHFLVFRLAGGEILLIFSICRETEDKNVKRYKTLLLKKQYEWNEHPKNQDRLKANQQTN